MAHDGADAAGLASNDAARMLLIWLSPSFPVGAYAYSHGLEAAVAQKLVHSRETLVVWISALLSMGSIRNDLILLVATMRREVQDAEINALALALQPSAERYLETTQQGASFAAAVDAAWPCPDTTSLRANLHGDIAYPIAVGIAARGHGLSLRDTAFAVALAFAQNLVSAAIRLSVIGQTDGQRVLAALMLQMSVTAAAAETSTLDDIGNACFSADLASLEHETLYSRLFRS